MNHFLGTALRPNAKAFLPIARAFTPPANESFPRAWRFDQRLEH